MKVKLFASVNIAGAHKYEIREVDNDLTPDDLDELAETFLEEALHPDCGYEILDENC